MKKKKNVLPNKQNILLFFCISLLLGDEWLRVYLKIRNSKVYCHLFWNEKKKRKKKQLGQKKFFFDYLHPQTHEKS